MVVWLKSDLYSLYCGSPTDPTLDEALAFWNRLFYLSKFYELFDTIFLVLKKKPLSVIEHFDTAAFDFFFSQNQLLHVWHHTSVMLVVYLSNCDMIVMGWITAANNSIVHVPMYYYYFLQSIGKKDIPWRKYLTSMQIVQFLVDISTGVFWSIFYWFGWRCRGTWRSYLLANFVGTSFLVLFVDFYRKQYASPGVKKD